MGVDADVWYSSASGPPGAPIVGVMDVEPVAGADDGDVADSAAAAASSWCCDADSVMPPPPPPLAQRMRGEWSPLMMVVVSSRMVTCCGRVRNWPMERAGDECCDRLSGDMRILSGDDGEGGWGRKVVPRPSLRELNGMNGTLC